MKTRQAPTQSSVLSAISSLLSQVSVLGKLPKSHLNDLAASAVDNVEHFTAERTLGEQGTPCERLFVVLEGALELSRGGRVFRRVEAGTVVGLASVLGDHPFTATVKALKGSLIASLQAPEVEKAFRHPDSWEAMKAAIGRQGDFLLDLNYRFDDLAFERPPTARLLRLLVRHAWETGGITARQIQLAEYINSASADVSRAEASLTRQGLASRVLDRLWLTDDDELLCSVLLGTALNPPWPREMSLSLPARISSLSALLWSNGWFPDRKIADHTVRRCFDHDKGILGEPRVQLPVLRIPRPADAKGPADGPRVPRARPPLKERKRTSDEWVSRVEDLRTQGAHFKAR